MLARGWCLFLVGCVGRFHGACGVGSFVPTYGCGALDRARVFWCLFLGVISGRFFLVRGGVAGARFWRLGVLVAGGVIGWCVENCWASGGAGRFCAL